MGVAVSSQLICLDDPQFKKENDPVTEYCLSQDVQGCSGLYDSLDKYVAGEVLTDYKWDEKGGESCRTLKRQCISRLSDVFVIHLKRFCLDWETFTTRKVNSRFEFPMDLDLFPYTSEGLKWKEEAESDESRRAEFQDGNGAEYYTYRLVGVVGTQAQALTRVTTTRTSEGGRSGMSLTMPTCAISILLRARLRLGTRDPRSPASPASPGSESSFRGGIPVVHNAYMLVYERSSMIARCDDKVASKPVSHVQRVRENVEKDNCQLTSARRMLHSGFSLFVLKLSKLLQANATAVKDEALADSFLLAVAKYAVYVLPRAIDSKRAPALLECVRKAATADPEMCETLMRVYTHLGSLFVDALVQSPSADVRKSL